MSGKTILIAGTIVEHEKVIGGVPTWKRIPRVTEIGSVGDQADPKENTTLADKHKTYGDGLQDSADKNLKGQYIHRKHPVKMNMTTICCSKNSSNVVVRKKNSTCA